MKKLLLFIIALAGLAVHSWAYDFSYTYQGQTLYYNIVDGNVQVTYQNSSYRRYTNLTGSLTIPSSVTYNGTTYSVTSIGQYAFHGCTGLTSVTIGNSVTSIGQYAFLGCSALTSVTIPNSATSIGQYAFLGCSALTSVTIPNSVTSIGQYAFHGCTGLTSLTIPASVSLIGPDAFSNCSIQTLHYNADSCYLTSAVFGNQLTTVNIGENVRYIPDYAFQACSGLTSVSLPSNLVGIGAYSFQNTGITALTIPNSVTSLGSCAFSGCSDMTSLTIGSGLTSISGGAFQYCSSLPTVNIPSNITAIGGRAFSDCTGLSGTLTIPNSVHQIGNGAFDYCTGITTLNLGNSVETIGSDAFGGCLRLTSVQFGESLEEIGNDAFSQCGIIGHVYFPQSVISMGERAFYECYGITEITCLGRVAPLISNDGPYSTFYGVDTNIVINIPCDSYNLYSGRWSYFRNFSESAFLFNVVSENINKGTVTVVSAPTCSNPVATVQATPRSGYRFDHWSDGSSENPYYYTVTGSMTLTAYFASAGGTEGIDDITTNNVKIYSRGSEIVIEGADNSDALVYDIMGRIVHKGRIEGPIHVNNMGVYMVKIADRQPQKVVVR